jgi:hypothetical protein
MNTKNLLLGVFVILTILFASFAFNEYNQIGNLSAQLQSSTQTTQTVVTSQAVITYYYSPAVTIPAPCCPTIPTSFVVGSQNGNTYGFNVTFGGPFLTGHGATVTMVSGVGVAFKVYQINALPSRTQWANFTWAGTYSETVPRPRNASLFDGAVMVDWFVNSSMLYLHIATR